jgi:hypothetical protein
MKKSFLWVLALAFVSRVPTVGQVASPATYTLAPTQNASSSSGNVTSPTLNISGSYWTGSAAATDTWSIMDVLGTRDPDLPGRPSKVLTAPNSDGRDAFRSDLTRVRPVRDTTTSPSGKKNAVRREG